MSNEPTNKEVLEAVQRSQKDVLEALEQSKGEMLETVQELATHVVVRFDRVESRLDRVELDVKTIKSTMVTKAHLDDKLADEGVRYGSLIRQTNEKIGVLADALVVEGSLSSNAAKQVVGSEPFPKR